MNKGKPC